MCGNMHIYIGYWRYTVNIYCMYTDHGRHVICHSTCVNQNTMCDMSPLTDSWEEDLVITCCHEYTNNRSA